jgi:hypothetical protein
VVGKTIKYAFYTLRRYVMKMKDALSLINEKRETGFMVCFDWIKGSILESDHFPDKHGGEKLIKTEEKAWELARNFAKATRGKTCDVYVIDENFEPVASYKTNIIKNRQ